MAARSVHLAKPDDVVKVSGFIPCFNNAETILEAIEGLRSQSIPLEEIYVVDDGSTDDSVNLVRNAGIEVLVNKENLGRGATRRAGMKRANNEFVLCCDATNRLDSAFLEKAIHHFENDIIASVSGRIIGEKPKNAVDRWRKRHLFKEEAPRPGKGSDVMLITYGTLMLRSLVMEVGNFDASLRHTEDYDLGERLLAAGYELWGDGDLIVTSVESNSLRQVLERYWRWYAGKEEKLSLAIYWHDFKGSFRPMAASDLAERDWICACISLFSPHYRFWKTICNKLRSK
jgi:glycosyltransferase involved in cell wall biosynthesis